MALRFNPPPGWPKPPAGWLPPPGWKPDPTWPPPPPMWPLIVDDLETSHTHGLSTPTQPEPRDTAEQPKTTPYAAPPPEKSWYESKYFVFALVAAVCVFVVVRYAAASNDSTDTSLNQAGPQVNNSGETMNTHPIDASYEVALDAERIVRFRVTGEFTATSEPARADAGETDIVTSSAGVLTLTNTSDIREVRTDSMEHGIIAILDGDVCNGRTDSSTTWGDLCRHDLVRWDWKGRYLPTLDPGESVSIEFEEDSDFGSVPMSSADTTIEAILDSSLVAAEDGFYYEGQEQHNDTCQNGDDGWEILQFWVEDHAISVCSAEIEDARR